MRTLLEVLKIVGLIFFVALIVWIGVLALSYTINKTETSECLRWKEDAEKYPGFYITQWQKDQCDFRQVEINAPVAQP